MATGCVTRGTHDQVVAERDRLHADKTRLEAEAKRLAASGESLESERVRLLEEMEDLLQTRQTLESDIQKLRRTEAILSETLREREAELGSRTEELAKLRGTFEALVADLEEEAGGLRARWDAEKETIDRIRGAKEELERLRTEEETEQRRAALQRATSAAIRASDPPRFRLLGKTALRPHLRQTEA